MRERGGSEGVRVREWGRKGSEGVRERGRSA